MYGYQGSGAIFQPRDPVPAWPITGVEDSCVSEELSFILNALAPKQVFKKTIKSGNSSKLKTLHLTREIVTPRKI
jgi:hypothetical protein